MHLYDVEYAIVVWLFKPQFLSHNVLWSQGRFTPWTVKSDHGRSPFSMVQLPWSDFFKNKQFTKPLGPSLGVSRMWTERNDHALKSKCADFFLIYVRKWQFWRGKKDFKFDHSFVFSCLHLLFLPKKFIWKTSIIIFLCHGLLSFSTRAPLVPLPPQNPLDHVNG